MLRVLLRRYIAVKSTHQLCYSSCVLYASGNLRQTAAVAAMADGWTRHLTPAPVDRLAGLIDFSITYSTNTSSKFWFSPSLRDFHEVEFDAKGGKIVHVSAGRRHFAVLTTHGNVYLTDTEGLQQEWYVPHKVASANCHQIVCGLDHTLLLCKDGRVFSHGWGADGQTGIGNEVTLTNFTTVVGDIQNKMISRIDTCVDSCYALAADGTVFAWGNNEYSQLGVDSSELQVLAPQQCHLPTLSEEIIQIASCGTFTCCLTASGNLYYWGTLEPDNHCRNGIKLYGSETSFGPVSSLHAGLHYIVACCTEALLVWGSYPGHFGGTELQPLKISIPSNVNILSVSPMLHELVILADK
ncbi:RCC1-like G exchanging factor-like protein isoform X1 [Dysidea avara]|uniref:RCC1-like G exchanging factor-like protein isoform X1 n=1 Tax=Dysidea avara TaxID=196820 RepID=UPI003321D57E